MELKKYLVWIATGGVFLLPLIPFLVTPSLLFPFIAGKAFLFRIIVEIIFSAWIILALIDESYRPRRSWILWSFGLFVIFLGISALLAENSFKAFWSNFERMEGLITILHLFGYFLVASTVLAKEKLWERLFAVNVGASVVMGFYGLLQLAGKLTINQGGVRVDGTLGNATYLAVYMLFNIFFSIFLFLRSKDRKKGLYWFIPVAFLQLYILYHTATRGAILGLIGGLIVFGILVAFRERHDKTVKKIAIGSLLAVAIVVVGFLAIRNTNFVRNSQVLARFATLSPAEIKTQGRYFIWPMALKGIAERPVFGWGQEGFNFVFNKYYNPQLFAQEQWFDRAHSTPIDWFIAGGVFGFAGYMGIFFFTLFYLWKKGRDVTFAEKSLITGLLAGYFFHNLFVFDNLISYIQFFTVVSYVHYKSASQKTVFENIKYPHKRVDVALALSILALVSVIYFANIKPIRAGQTLIVALNSLQRQGASVDILKSFKKAIDYNTFGNTEIREQLSSSVPNFIADGVPNEIQQAYFSLASEELIKQVNLNPNDARHYIFLGSVLVRAGQIQEGIVAYEKARSLSPGKQSIIFDLASAYVNSGNLKKGQELLKEAHELAPEFNAARILYAVGSIYAGDIDLADEILSYRPSDQDKANAFLTAVAFDERLLEAWVRVKRFDKILTILMARISLEPTNSTHYVSLAASYLELGERQKSIEVLEEIKARFPERAEEMDFFISEIKAGRNP